MNTLPFRLSFFALLLLQVACGSDELSVRGEATVTAEGADHVFSFPAETNLAPASLDSEVFSGRCEFVGQSFSAEIIRPGSPARGVSRISLETNEAGAEVWAVADGVVYIGQCELDVLYEDECDGVFAASLSCTELNGPDGLTATLSSELHFAGCSSF